MDTVWCHSLHVETSVSWRLASQILSPQPSGELNIGSKVSSQQTLQVRNMVRIYHDYRVVHNSGEEWRNMPVNTAASLVV